MLLNWGIENWDQRVLVEAMSMRLNILLAFDLRLHRYSILAIIKIDNLAKFADCLSISISFSSSLSPLPPPGS